MNMTNPTRRISRVLHWIADLTSRTGAALVVAIAVVIFGIILASDGFPASWETSFSAVAAAVTLVMLFVIQHTQSRHQIALQLKLDELIIASPIADDQLVRIEAADLDELDERTRGQQALHESLRDGDALDGVEHPPSTDS
jgi:low affinity Fe/Cu permease